MKQNRLQYKMGIGLAISLLFIVIIGTLAWGQAVEQVTINYIEASPAPDQSGNKVRAYVTVSSPDQNPVQDLTVSDFDALEDGTKIVLQDVSPSTEPMAVVLAIDTSGSMQAQDRSGQTSMDAAKGAAVEFISMLGEADQVALYSFNNESYLHLDFSVDHEAAINAVNELSSKYQAATRLYDTALEAVKKTAEIPKGRRAVILLTDGKDEKGKGSCSIHSSNDVIDAATTKTIRVPIYTVGVGPQVDAKELGRIASLTGGRSMLATSLAELPGFYRKIANQLKNQYVAEYITRTPSGEHSLVLKVQHDGRKEQDEKRFWSPPLPVIRPPTVSIVSPGPTDKINGIVSVIASIAPAEGISKVRYYVDASLREEDTDYPYDGFRWETDKVPAGLHVLRVEAVHINGQIGSAEMTVRTMASALTSAPAVKAVEAKDEGGGIPLTVWGIVLILLGVIAGGFLWWQRQRPVKKAESVTVTRVSQVMSPPSEQSEREKRQEALDSIESEATTIDAQESLEPIAKLTVIKSAGLDLGATFKVLRTTNIGRGKDNDIQIPDKHVSRKHAVIYFAGGNFYIRDLNSSYGTLVDSQKVTSGGITLNDGAQIEFGEGLTVLEFNILVFGKGAEDEDGDKTMIYKDNPSKL